jgi:hypothetical protein
MSTVAGGAAQLAGAETKKVNRVVNQRFGVQPVLSLLPSVMQLESVLASQDCEVLATPAAAISAADAPEASSASGHISKSTDNAKQEPLISEREKCRLLLRSIPAGRLVSWPPAVGRLCTNQPTNQPTRTVEHIWRCGNCGWKTNAEAELQRHYAESNHHAEMIKCEICDKNIASHGRFQHQMENHKCLQKQAEAREIVVQEFEDIFFEKRDKEMMWLWS